MRPSCKKTALFLHGLPAAVRLLHDIFFFVPRVFNFSLPVASFTETECLFFPSNTSSPLAKKMGSYLSRATEVKEDYPPRTPVGAIYRAILEQKDRDFSSLLLPFPLEELKNEHGETPLEYLMQLSLTQKRFNIMCEILDKKYACDTLLGEEGYKILFPLMSSCNSLAPTYAARLLISIENIPHNVFGTKSVSMHRLFCEYGLGNRIALLPADEENMGDSEDSDSDDVNSESDDEEEGTYTVLHEKDV